MRRRSLLACVYAALWITICIEVHAQAPLGTSFTYQGRLTWNGQPANGGFAMDFKLFDAESAGTQVGAIISLDVPVTHGLFTVLLNDSGQFGPEAFNGQQRFLEITVNGTTLSPRQSLTATPYAHAAVTALGVPGLDGHSLDASDGSPVDALFVGPTGAVGIGTPTPDRALEVANGGLDVFDSAGQGVSFTTDSFQINRAENEDTSYQYNGATDVHTFFSSGSPSMTILSKGQVGIGTATPTATLHVGGVAGTDGIRFPDGSLQVRAAVMKRGSFTWDFPSIHPGATWTLSLSNVHDIDDTSVVHASPDLNWPDGLIIAFCRATGPATIQVKVSNITAAAIDPPNTRFEFVVFP